MSERERLPAGAVISYADELATVVEDFGGSSLDVIAGGIRQKWYWSFDGEECVVVSRPDTEAVDLNQGAL
ncbi:hypothetical protein HNP46_006355 [Pseudomonas nitritireducens]|uniref:Uncharacterized protein n=1 Tax=Pseudomonas nitroreducens TaxID=46680 RepID=A0A7W7P5M2_PSENT|nr:hypothetical protein [Pseudomonas nitritireducens]MBB4867442.1 hypothetical protein [Pseudomonas nitritireducens]